MEIKNEKIQFTVTVEVSCTESNEFENQTDFRNSEIEVMKRHLSNKINKCLDGSYCCVSNNFTLSIY